jgi:hypothetical protein
MPSKRLAQTLSALTRGLSNFCAVCCLAIAVCVVLANRGWISAWQVGVNAALFGVQGIREVYHTTRNPPSAAEYRRDPASWRELWRTQSWEGKITLVLIVADIVASIATQPQLALSTRWFLSDRPRSSGLYSTTRGSIAAGAHGHRSRPRDQGVSVPAGALGSNAAISRDPH